MDAPWAFLQPWLEVLQAVLVGPVDTSQLQDQRQFACATFGCWPSPWDVDAAVTDCTFDVRFPADQASRQDSNSLQQIREAVAIFDTLAAVDNAAFVAALSGYMHFRQLQDGFLGAMWPQRQVQDGPLGVAWPNWRFSLDRFLPADDAVTKAPFVTWGQLFGSPPEHSPGFCAAMERLQGEEVGVEGSHRNSTAWIEWEIKFEVMSISGSQDLKPTTRKSSPFSDELGKLLMLEAPPVFVIESVRDSIALIKTWQADPIARHVGIQSEVGKTAVFRANYDASGIGEVAAGLAHGKVPTLQLSLEDFVANNENEGRAIANAGFLFSVLCSSSTFCHLNGVTGFPVLERYKEIGHLDVIYSRAEDSRFGGFFSAVAEGMMIRKLQVRTDDDDDGIDRDPLHWRWLAYAFWSRASNAFIPELDIGPIDLTEEHVSAIEAVLKYSYPQPTERSPSSPHSQYGCANIRAGTKIRPVGLRAGDDTVLVVSRDLRCRAHYKSSSKQLDVVVPGYGICTMPNVGVFESDNVVGTPSGFLCTVRTSSSVRSLSVSFVDIHNDHMLLRFLRLIGGQLRTLTLRCSDIRLRSVVSLDLGAVAAACPELQALQVEAFQVTFSGDNDALRNWKIKKLSISGSAVNGLIRLLNDPIYRTSRELVELRLELGWVWSEPWAQYRITCDCVDALKTHNGEFLPVAKHKFPLPSKISFISVVSCRRAGGFLDSSMMSIVFAFAAIPEQRRVVTS